jgi:4a-hydroxytetrahydrobiopterin dehydratase
MNPSEPLAAEVLAGLRCRALEGEAALDAAAIAAQLQALPDWQWRDGVILRRYRFGDHYRALAFANALAYVSHVEDHHPELRLGYDWCELRYDTHSVGGISRNDFICAAKADALYAQARRD